MLKHFAKLPEENMVRNGEANGRGITDRSKDDHFTQYLEEVNASSKRSRGVVYVLMLVMIVIYGVHRSMNEPGWMQHRLLEVENAYYALGDDKLLPPPVRKSAIDYVNNALLQDSLQLKWAPVLPASSSKKSAPDDPLVTVTNSAAERSIIAVVLTGSLDSLARARTDQLSIRLPLLGITFDINDLGLIGGLILTGLLYVLAASVRRETLNLGLATKRALKSDLDILLMTQVLGPAPSKIPKTRGRFFLRVWLPHFALFTIVTLSPIAVQILVCHYDWVTRCIGGALLKSDPGQVALCRIETAITVLVAAFAILCACEQHKLYEGFLGLIKRINEVNGDDPSSKELLNGQNGVPKELQAIVSDLSPKEQGERIQAKTE
jgi:hypothetical protein